jgi:acetyl-CoA carboxylase carboxyl transferase beta subunit/acetyl-CoA carboxylase carboxyl transferase alpha subunit
MTETLARRDVKDSGWTLCPGCRGMVYGKRLVRNLRVCPECGEHYRLPAHERIAQLLDDRSVELFDPLVPDSDPLNFVDTKPYLHRLREARDSTGLDEAVVLAKGAIEGNSVFVAVMDFRFLGGSVGSAVGELITFAAEIGLRERTPLLLVTASGGARMQEGALSLMQMVKTSQALSRLDEAGVLTISLITDPTYGGVAASFATLCDVIVAEPKARLGFAGPRVIEQTIRQTLPPGFQTAEYLLEHGLIDMICPRRALRPTLARLLSVGSRGGGAVNGLDWEPTPDYAQAAVIRDPGRLPERDAWQAVKLARNLWRPTTLDYISRICGDFEELRGDRMGGDCAAVVGGTARIDGLAVMVIGYQKGHTIGELTRRNYGMPTPAGLRKAARLMRLAGKLGLPLVTFVDTPGAYPGVQAEEQGQAVAVAENIRLMAGLTVPIVTVVTGEGGSGGALALAVADHVLACSNAVYSVISPEGCAAILWNDPAMAPAAAAALRVGARELLRSGIVDGVVVEPDGGAHTDHLVAAQRIRVAITDSLFELSMVDRQDLLARRHTKFRAFGAMAKTSVDLVPIGRNSDDAQAFA